MAVNEVYRAGDRISLPVPSGTKAGSPVLIGALPGVAITDRGAEGNSATNASVWLEGVFNLTVAAATTVGGAVYITAAGELNATASGNTLFGYALAAQSASGVVPVKIARA